MNLESLPPLEVNNIGVGPSRALLSHKLALIEIKSESSSVIQCNQEGGHCHLTNPLSLQANSSLAQGGFLD
jgi:hypothetical protein